jgi:osmotically-inducible protein OsmY
VKVSVEAGWVTLDGDVDWQYQRDAAETAVRYLAGAEGVSNLVEIKIAGQPDRRELRHRSGPEASAEIDADNVAVSVDGHAVTLIGTVKSYAEKREAERAAWAAPGVYSVDDRISVAW